MKKGILIKLILLAMSFGLYGCGKNSSSKTVSTVPSQQAVPKVVPVGGTSKPNTGTGVTGSSVFIDIQLDPAVTSSFSALKMELDLGTVIGNTGDLDSSQGGDITIHKTYRNGHKAYSFFTSGGNTLDDVVENYWQYNSEGKLVWRGVFEGPTGALVVVVDGVYKSGDGNDPFDYMSGSVWFRKWPIVGDTGINTDKCYIKDGRLDCKNPAGPLVRCWKVSLGPYDCRFNVSANSKSVTAVGNEYSSEPYIKIGEFINLSKQKTFKEQY